MDKEAKFGVVLLAALGLAVVAAIVGAIVAAVRWLTRRGSGVDELSPESRAFWEDVWEERRRQAPERRAQVSRMAGALRAEGVTVKAWAAQTRAEARLRGGSAVAVRRIDRLLAGDGDPIASWEASALLDAGDRLLRSAGWTGRELTVMLEGEDMAQRVFGAPRLERARASELTAGEAVLVSPRGEVGAQANSFTGSLVTVLGVASVDGQIEIDLASGHRLRLRPAEWVHRQIGTARAYD